MSRRPAASNAPFQTVDIIYLSAGAEPPTDERYVLFDWACGEAGCRIERQALGLHYLVGPDRHAFWIIEATQIARRRGFDRVYYRGRPDFFQS